MSDLHRTEAEPVFDLETLFAEMRTEAANSATGHAARTLVHEDDLRVVLVVLAAGGSIKDHRAHASTSIHVLRGAIGVGLDGRSLELSAGRLLVLQRDVPHSVIANAESAFVLTLGRSH
ncbi:MAG: cupin domain-containing protein [Bryobacterales bacterium]